MPGAALTPLSPIQDARGFFARLWCAEAFAKAGFDPALAQINLSYNAAAHTLRGLHFQRPPHAEGKVVRAVRGALWDVIVDLRAESPTFGCWAAATLSAANRLALVIPAGVAHGFLTLEPDTEALYFMTAPYAPGYGAGLSWRDPEVGIDWPAEPAAMSDKDAALPGLREAVALAAAPL